MLFNQVPNPWLTVACFAHSVAFGQEVGQAPHSSINRGLPPTHIQTEA